MSTKRILVITVIGVLIIVAALSLMLLTPYLSRESDSIRLPDTPPATERPNGTGTDALDRVEVNKDTIQAVITTIERPDTYNRDIVIESFWEGGEVTYDISVSVVDGITSLRVLPPSGVDKRIIVTPDTLYIWYRGDRSPFIGETNSAGDGSRAADEWQMLITYEDVLRLDKNDMISAGYTEYEGVVCVYAEYRSQLLGNTMTYYISLDLGLVVAAEEYDRDGALIYSMKAGDCAIGEADPAAFILPDGTNLIEG